MKGATIAWMTAPRDEAAPRAAGPEGSVGRSITTGAATAGRPADRSADAELVGRIASGDEDALMEAYEQHAEALFGAAVRFLGDREAAAEIVQEAFTACWRSAATFDASVGSLRTWLLRIAKNRAIDHLRFEARRPGLIQLPVTDGDEALLDPLDRLAQRRRSGVDDGDPAVVMERTWSSAVVRTALSDLPSHEREVVFLAYRDGLSQHEIAAELGLPLGTVKSRTRRALAHLRLALVQVPDLVQ
jgi:RNA polymerase sigma-70 factor (ECF subfamily)